MSTFQAWVFHRTKPPKLVTNDAEYQLALADGWADTPAAFYEAEPVASPDLVTSAPPPRSRRRRDAT